jgi:hypothetical protein
METMVATGVEKFGGFGGGSGRAKAQTYAQMLEDPWLDKDEELKIKAQSALGHAAVLLQQRGQQDIALLLLDVIRVAVEYDGEWQTNDLWFEVATEHLSAFDEPTLEKVKDSCEEVSTRLGYGLCWGGVREVMPSVGPDWQETLRQQLSSGKRPTNHARRVRSDPNRRTEDGLSFTNDGELIVYGALKLLQETLPGDSTIGIFPLAGGRIPGHTWEPDVLVTYKNRAGVLEIDGPHHNARRAMDMSRDHLLRDAGVAFVDRIPVEALSDPKELGPALTRFIRRVADTR